MASEQGRIYLRRKVNCYSTPYHVYHEGIANEICIFLNKFLEDCYVRNNMREFHVFTDRCPGQNRNNTVKRYLLTLARLLFF